MKNDKRKLIKTLLLFALFYFIISNVTEKYQGLIDG